MRSLLYAVLVGLIGAALLHIVIILALPRFTAEDAYSRVLGLYEMDSFFPLTSAPGPTGLANDDPYLRVAVCGFSVLGGPVRFTASGDVPFWSLAIYDSGSNEIFSMSDATAVNDRVDVVAATPLQLVELRKQPAETIGQTITVEMPEDEGYAVLRALAPLGSYEAAASKFLGEAGCEPMSR
ncbi:putative membrane protein [Rhizobium sp. PP-WC-2G-219]|nr:putative membrane protein [Rhizobium sp. PP-CC-3A-592]TCL96584.1 putative membrane protein [Rhizobium sp. PP-WC-2G-219]